MDTLDTDRRRLMNTLAGLTLSQRNQVKRRLLSAFTQAAKLSQTRTDKASRGATVKDVIRSQEEP
jgi:hypothetical protein